MTFNSYTFVLFFCVILLLYYSTISWKAKKAILTAASYLFYAAWNPPFVLLLMLSTVIDWYSAKLIYMAGDKKRKHFWMVISVFVNIGLLAFFKYGNFILENTIALLQLLHIEFQPLKLDIILPVGISFYTFQTLSYTLDVYLKRDKPWDNFLDYALYVTFFPQLVAGPIVRSNQFLYQCADEKRFDPRTFCWGAVLLIIGIFMKSILADAVFAPLVEKVYTARAHMTTITAWAGTIAFAGQIFYDFSGYSISAIGCSLMLGFHLPDNFRHPYGATGFSDFWRRWHMSLSTWFRDYVYIPMGGNRGNAAIVSRNLLGTMLIAGLWHGASWTFVAWGGLHGAYLTAEHAFKSFTPQKKVFDFPKAMLTFALVCVAWVFFRAATFGQAFDIIHSMLTWQNDPSLYRAYFSDYAIPMAAASLMVLYHYLMRKTSIEDLAERLPKPILALILSVVIITIIATPGEDRAFIYFQF